MELLTYFCVAVCMFGIAIACFLTYNHVKEQEEKQEKMREDLKKLTDEYYDLTADVRTASEALRLTIKEVREGRRV